jgi:hypothetical protein
MLEDALEPLEPPPEAQGGLMSWMRNVSLALRVVLKSAKALPFRSLLLDVSDADAAEGPVRGLCVPATSLSVSRCGVVMRAAVALRRAGGRAV